MTAPLRIAMWSGPRNMSTTMMRSFGCREDTECVDEPFYAAYLTATGITHPMQDEILASQSSDPEIVASELSTGRCASPLQYQKHMTHHFLARFPTRWLTLIDHHVFLIRHPARVIASYARKMETLSLEAMGFPQQLRIFQTVSEQTQTSPIVIDSDGILKNPERLLKQLCRDLSIHWDASMLRWPPGPKPEDGVWAPHWYDRVNDSTGFGPPAGAMPVLSNEQAELLDQALPLYEALWRHRLQPDGLHQ